MSTDIFEVKVASGILTSLRFVFVDGRTVDVPMQAALAAPELLESLRAVLGFAGRGPRT